VASWPPSGSLFLRQLSMCSAVAGVGSAGGWPAFTCGHVSAFADDGPRNSGIGARNPDFAFQADEMGCAWDRGISAEVGSDHARDRRSSAQLEALPRLFREPHANLAVGQLERALSEARACRTSDFGPTEISDWSSSITRTRPCSPVRSRSFQETPIPFAAESSAALR
jgi:hypothetical protein